MKKILILVVIVLLFGFVDELTAQIDVEYARRDNYGTLQVDSLTAKDTTDAIPVYSGSGRITLYMTQDTITPHGGNVPSLDVYVQFADSTGLWARPSFTNTDKKINDSLKFDRTYLNLDTLRVNADFMRLIINMNTPDNKDTTVVPYRILQE